MSRLNYNHLHYFWAVAHTGNLTRTAEQLNISQSALSLQIKKLEERLGTALFERRGKSLVLTEAGRIALDHADAIFSAGEELVSTLTRQEAQGRMLRVGALATLSRNFQIEFLRPLLRRQDARVTVRSGGLAELLSLLEAGQIDVVLSNIVPQRDAGTPWIVSTMADQAVSLVGEPQHQENGASIKDWLSKELLIVPTVETAMRIGFDALCERLNVRPRILAEVDDMALLRVLAREASAVAVVPAIVVKDELASGRLVELAQLPQLHEIFYAITLTRRFPNPLLDVVMPK